MNREEIKKEIESALKKYHQGSVALNKLFETIGRNPEGLIQETIYSLQHSMLKQTEKVIGDRAEWLEWFVYDNKSGELGMKAGYDDGMKPIDKIDDLVDLILESQKDERN